MNGYMPESPDYGLDPKSESKKQKHIIILFSVLLTVVILGIIIFNLWNIGEVQAAKDYVKEHYGDGYSYVSSRAVYTVGNCAMSPKESVIVLFQGSDLSVVTVTVKGGTAYE